MRGETATLTGLARVRSLRTVDLRLGRGTHRPTDSRDIDRPSGHACEGQASIPNVYSRGRTTNGPWAAATSPARSWPPHPGARTEEGAGSLPVVGNA